MFYLYTALTAERDRLRAIGELPRGWRAVCFTDGPGHPDWEIRPSTDEGGSAVRNARMHKLLPHRFLEDAKLTVWFDANMTLECDIDRLVRTYLARYELAFLHHPHRDCVYEEGEACIRLRKDEPSVIHPQLQRYAAQGYPRNAGLVATGVILRRNSEPVRRFCELWWSELQAGSHRDQLSLPYVLNRTAIDVGLLDGDAFDNPYFRRWSHDGAGSVPRRVPSAQ